MRASACLAFVVWISTLVPSFSATVDLGNGFADHGVAVPISNHRGTVATVDGQGHRVILSWLRDHRGTYELLLADVDTGKAEEIPLPFPIGDDPFASILSRGNRFYTHFNSHFVEFDPVKRAFTFCKKTVPQMAMSMTEDSQGVIWSATYPQSGVASYNPKTGEFRDYGYTYKQDWAEYPRSVAADDSGWVYLSVGSTAYQIVALEAKTGKATPLVPDEQRKHGALPLYVGVDGKVYAQLASGKDAKWMTLREGRATPVEKKPAAAKPIIAGSQGLFHAVFPDGSRIKVFDLLERAVTVENPKTKKTTSFRFDYKSEGAHIMGVAVAPDNTLCGGTAFPMRFFRYDPQKDEWINRPALGQWNTVARQGDHFFAGAYGHGILIDWDPAAPWVDTVANKKGCNPLYLADSAPTINRPHKLLAHPDGKTLVLAGTPGYGLTGGGLLFWDRGTAEHKLLTHEELIPQHSTVSLVALPNGKLLGGTTISPGTGGQTKAKEAELYLLDLATKKIEWHAVILPNVRTYNDLCLGPDGLVWGFADNTRFFAFDPAAKKMVHVETLPSALGSAVSHQGPRVFVQGPNKAVYVVLNRGIARVEPQGWKVVLLAKSPKPITGGGDYFDGRIYFASTSHLHSYKLPE